jgi:hypothetical protein
MEASRMFRDWFIRIGGPNSTDLSTIESLLSALTISVNDDKINLAFNDSTAIFAELRKAIESQQPPIDYSSQIAEMKKEIEELRQMIAFAPTPAINAGDVYVSIF